MSRVNDSNCKTYINDYLDQLIFMYSDFENLGENEGKPGSLVSSLSIINPLYLACL